MRPYCRAHVLLCHHRPLPSLGLGRTHHHPNIVLVSICPNHRLLIYEFAQLTASFQ
uniref:Uncharacterized protein n=1 Tax=Nonomuraea gerenzanensis TaxID=93944 RepID=A0A1M4EBR2_9ACTN|nr:hypothetical protein BN4615_P5907 [Nonomuraea gerenzanensis]